MLFPAYDLTYSPAFKVEQSTTIIGVGKKPCLGDILAVAKISE